MDEIETDVMLLERMLRGEAEAFECLFLRHYAQVYRVLYGLVVRREEAEDLAQETFLELYRNPPHIKGDATLLAWLCRVGLNRGYNALRGERRARERLERLPIPWREDDPYLEAVRAEDQTCIRRVLAHLPARQSKLLLLRHAGLSYAEVGEAMGVSPTSVGTLLVRAERAFLALYDQIERTEARQTEPGQGVMKHASTEG